MIPSTTNRLLVASDWTKIYQSFRNPDFKSYDFETLRRTMITYLRENYPEDFNDYIDSSEFIALIDLIAFLGQNLSFRIDLNARENFLETAERRESVLRLARLINYNGKRNIPANGFLKIVSISTTENVVDVNGINLANSVIGWNDLANSNWYQQFIAVLNSSMTAPLIFGKPSFSKVINGIQTEQYRLNTNSADVPVYSFIKNIGGIQMNFELVSSTFEKFNYIYEETPAPGNQFGIIFQNDNKGSSSANTGFFVHFRQGVLGASNFTVNTPVPNELIGINVNDINDNDVWLWQLSADGTKHETEWSKVPAITGNNIIYNSLSNNQRNIYGVLTRENDQIDLTFADGSFGNLPSGPFRVYYRQSNGLSYNIKPEQMNNIAVQLPYISKNGQSQTLTIVLSLQYTVTNSVSSESNDDIKLKAPQAYYTQNRMITAEDYNIAPLTVDSDILKIKSINRISSGISKYFELSDVSGKYSSTNIFANDGIIYKENKEYNFEFSFVNRNEAFEILKSQVEPIIDSANFRSFYLEKYPRLDITGSQLFWSQTSKNTNQCKGYFNSYTGPVSISSFGNESLLFLAPGALIKFVPPAGKYFLPNGEITSILDSTTRNYIWSQVVNVIGDGSNSGKGNLDDGTGPVTLTGNITGTGKINENNSAIPVLIIPKFKNIWSSALELEIVNLMTSKRNFGVSFDAETREWYIIDDSNLDLINPFTLSSQKDVSNSNKDASWMISFEWTGKKYKVRYRTVDYIFESEKETAFFIDKSKKNYDFTLDTIIKDRIDILSINESPNIGSVTTSTNVSVSSNFDLLTAIISNTTDLTPYVHNTTTINLLSNPTFVANSYIAIHPAITNGNSLVISTATNLIGLANTLTTSISTGSIITFIPNIVSTSSQITTTATFLFDSDEVTQTFSLSKDYQWQVDDSIVEPDGYMEPKKVMISFYDNNDDGQMDDPDSFDNVVLPDNISPQTGYKDRYVYFQRSADGLRYNRYTGEIYSYPTENDVLNPTDGQLYYFYDSSVDAIKQYSATTGNFVYTNEYFARSGRSNLKFHYIHNSGEERRLDPSKTNIIDVYLLTKTYDSEYRFWLTSQTGDEPLPPTSQSLEENYSASLEPIKSISDEIVYHPAKYKVLFGNKAPLPLQAVFKAVRSPDKIVSVTDVQTRILTAIEDFFKIENWNFGQTFNFGELATYVMNIMTPDITNFVIVPKMDNEFGSLYQITCQKDEIFVNGATINDIQIIDGITSSDLKATAIVTSSY